MSQMKKLRQMGHIRCSGGGGGSDGICDGLDGRGGDGLDGRDGDGLDGRDGDGGFGGGSGGNFLALLLGGGEGSMEQYGGIKSDEMARIFQNFFCERVLLLDGGGWRRV
jgi:hypothetical protein